MVQHLDPNAERRLQILAQGIALGSLVHWHEET